MAPAKQVGQKGERRDMTREEKAAEADYQRLVEAAKQQEGKESYWEQEVRRLGGAASRTRRKSTQQESQVRDVRGALDRARKAVELAEREARKIEAELADQERRLRVSEEALAQARADAEVRITKMKRISNFWFNFRPHEGCATAPLCVLKPSPRPDT